MENYKGPETSMLPNLLTSDQEGQTARMDDLLSQQGVLRGDLSHLGDTGLRLINTLVPVTTQNPVTVLSYLILRSKQQSREDEAQRR